MDSEAGRPDGKDGRTVMVVVTFPDHNCANFYLRSSNSADGAVIEQIARSFRPNSLGYSFNCR